MIRDAATRVIHVVQGEHAISDDPDAILTTVLGSCVSACIMDADRGIGGLNHFLLPDAGPGGPDIRYAAAAMEVLVNGLMRRGPLFISSACVSSIIGRPPMPEPIRTPMRSAFSSVTSIPEFRIACIPAARP